MNLKDLHNWIKVQYLNLRDIHNWIVGIWFIYEIFLEVLLPGSMIQISKIISPIFGSILLVAD